MKYLFLCILIANSMISTNTWASVVLKPSLTTQMQYQSTLDRSNAILDKKRANQKRLTEIRVQRWVKIQNTKISSIAIVNLPKISASPLSQASIVKSPVIQLSNTQDLPWVDISRVRDAWFGWYNDYRTSLGLGSYSHDSRLDATAHDWNVVFAEGKGQNHHTRNPWDGYYNFSVIDRWFIDRGIEPKVINRSKHTENVGYGYYSCSADDCTDKLISSIRSTFDFFMSEKGKSYDAHYRSIVQPYFTKMGFDIIVVPSEKRYYITIHYITE